MAALIEPRTLKGFRDYPPALMIPRERVLQTAREVYRSYGFAPIDTPAMEYAEVLLGKGGEESDRIVYRFRDHGDRDVALRFDLTVPFARFSAANINALGTPFKRYAMGPVWRGENTGAGRYREFWQCDFDTIGTTSNAADIEVALVIHDLFTELGFSEFEDDNNNGTFKLRINNRLILNGILEEKNLLDKSAAILRVVDKFEKIGYARVLEELTSVESNGPCLAEAEARALIDLTVHLGRSSTEQILDFLETNFRKSTAQQGICSVREMCNALTTATGNSHWFKIDTSIARGLDYYTGIVFETTLGNCSSIGSVCSGGRYDNLASLYTKLVLPGVGASLGVDRLLAAMEELKHPWLTGSATPAPVLVLNLDAARIGDYQNLARTLRQAGIGTEVYPDAKKLGVQFQYAEKRGHAIALIVGEQEFNDGTVRLKHLARREEIVLSVDDLVGRCREWLIS